MKLRLSLLVARIWLFHVGVALGVSLLAAPQLRAQTAKNDLPPGVTCMRDIEYSRPATGPLYVDLYLPERVAEKPLPVVLWIHGGGWKKGSKDRCSLSWLAGEGYAVVSLGYRLSTTAPWPAQIEDARAAVRWLRTQAGTYRLDPQRIAVAGESSGANLAGVLGTMDAASGEPVSSRVAAVIDFFGTSDVATLPANVPGPGKTDADLAKTNGALLLGGIVRDRPQLAREMSPLYQASADDPPFLVVHGSRDDQVPLDQSERLVAKLQHVGVPVEFVVLPDAGHGGKAFTTPELRETVRKFLQRSMP